MDRSSDSDSSRSPVGSRKRSASASAEDERAPKRVHFSPPNFSEWPRGRSRVRQVSREARLRQQRAQEFLRQQATSESLLGNQKAETQLGNQSAAEVAPLREQGPTSTNARKRARSSEEDEDEVAGTQPALKKQRAVSDGVTGVFGDFFGWNGSGSGMRPRGLERLPTVAESESDSNGSSSDSEEEEVVEKNEEELEGEDEDEEEDEVEGEKVEGEATASPEFGESGALPDDGDFCMEAYLAWAESDRLPSPPVLPTPAEVRFSSDLPGTIACGPSSGPAKPTGDPNKRKTPFPSSLSSKLSDLTSPVSFDSRQTTSPNSGPSTTSSVTQQSSPQISQYLSDPVTVHSTAAQSTSKTPSLLSDVKNESEQKPATVVNASRRTSAFEQAYSIFLQQQTSENEALQPQSDSQEAIQAPVSDSDPQLSETTNTRGAATNHLKDLDDLRRRAPTPPTFTEEEVREMMARHEGNGPDAEDFEILRLVLEELEDRMDVDTDEDVDTFNNKQKEVRERLRNQRDSELREVKEFERLRESVSGRRKHFDEASSARPPAAQTTDRDDLHFLDEFTDPLEELELEKARLSEAEIHWKSAWPNPISLSPQHWNDEAAKFQNKERNARDVHEQIYWSNLRIQAYAYAKRDIDSGNSCRTQIRVALLDWKRNVAAVEATLAAAKQVNDLRVSDQESGKAAAVLEDPRVAREAPLREKLGRLLTQLPPELDQKVTKILDISTNQVITKTVESVNITRRDIAKILHSANFPSPPSDPPGWLNDEIINAFFAALTKALNDKSGYVKGPNNVPPYVTYNSSWLKSVIEKGNDITAIQRWSRRKGITGGKALKCKRIFFPVNPGNHWTLLIISPEARTIEYLDSLDTGTSTTARKATRYINLARAWLKMELGNEYVPEEWSDLDRRSPIQDNGSDCGMFACLNGVVSGLEFESPTDEFGPEQIPFARRALISMLDVGGFQDYFEL